MFPNTKSTQSSFRPCTPLSSAIEALEPRIAPAILIGLTTKDVLVTFDSDAPEKILSAAKITGLAPKENMLSIDARPVTGLLYGITNLGAVYTLNPYSGVATLVAVGPDDFPVIGKSASLDFNPTVDRIRVVTDKELNFRINPSTGAYVDGDAGAPGVQPDTALAYDPADVNAEKNPSISAIAYDRNFQGTNLTTLFGIDSARNTLVRIGGVDGTPSPNGGLISTVGLLGVNPSTRIGFEIADEGTAFASMRVAGKTSLFTIDLITGDATAIGKVGNGRVQLDAVTTMPLDEVIVGVTTSNRLITFRTNDPGQILSSIQLTNLGLGETIAGIDFRPSTGELFAVTNTNQILEIDRLTGQVIRRGGAIDGSIFSAGVTAGFDFNPTVDRLRMANLSNDNLRYNPVTFAPVDGDAGTAGVQGDADLAFIATDVNVGQDTNITGVAYDRNDNDPATPTTLFAIDSNLDILVRQGATDGNAADVAGGGSPNGGLLTTLGSLGVNATGNVGFDISNDGRAGVGAALAVMQLNGESTSKLFSINLQAGLTNQPLGAATLIGEIGGGEVLTAMAIAPSTVQFTASNTIVKEKAGSFAVIEITRTGGDDHATSVLLNSLPGTATGGADYTTLANEVVTFARGETFKRIQVPIIADNIVEPNETFSVQLSSPFGGTTILGSTINALVTIQGKKVAL